MTQTQCRMARAALGWTLDELAHQSGISRRTIAKFEQGANVLPETMEKLRSTFAAAGVGFTNGGKRAGVSYLRKD